MNRLVKFSWTKIIAEMFMYFCNFFWSGRKIKNAQYQAKPLDHLLWVGVSWWMRDELRDEGVGLPLSWTHSFKQSEFRKGGCLEIIWLLCFEKGPRLSDRKLTEFFFPCVNINTSHISIFEKKSIIGSYFTFFGATSALRTLPCHTINWNQ